MQGSDIKHRKNTNTFDDEYGSSVIDSQALSMRSSCSDSEHLNRIERMRSINISKFGIGNKKLKRQDLIRE